MKRARVIVDGMLHNATEADGQVVLEDGRRLWQDQVTWLPPLVPVYKPRTILALGLQLRRPRQGARVQGAGGTAGVPEGRARAQRPPADHRAPGRTCSSCTTNASSRW
jgi:hypothetical protein